MKLHVLELCLKFSVLMLLLLADLNVVLLFQEEKHSGFLNEAKEWAGELLSGQTKVGL